MNKNESAKKTKGSKAQEVFKTFLSESTQHDREMMEQMIAREKEMQAAEHSLMRDFMGSLTELLKKDIFLRFYIFPVLVQKQLY